jgi:hypothetical protein
LAYPFPLPAGVTNTNVAYFYANNTNDLGVFIKQVNDLSLISVDYSQLTPAITLQSIRSFTLNAGGNPPLVVSNPSVNPTDSLLTFLISNGLAGVQYTLSIVMDIAGGTRTDLLTINVPSTPEFGVTNPTATPAFPFPSQGVVSPDGSIYYNQVIRWFLSGTPPVNPNIMDQWYDTATGNAYQYVTDGVTPRWAINQSLLSSDVLTQFNILIAAYFTGLPTSLPATAGIVWNNGGVVSIS